VIRGEVPLLGSASRSGAGLLGLWRGCSNFRAPLISVLSTGGRRVAVRLEGSGASTATEKVEKLRERRLLIVGLAGEGKRSYFRSGKSPLFKKEAKDPLGRWGGVCRAAQLEVHGCWEQGYFRGQSRSARGRSRERGKRPAT